MRVKGSAFFLKGPTNGHDGEKLAQEDRKSGKVDGFYIGLFFNFINKTYNEQIIICMYMPDNF